MLEATIWIVDDDKDSRESLSALATSIGFNVAAYASAEEFLEIIENVGVGCLITDIRLPGMSGLELLKSLRNRNCTLPAIVVTAYADTQLTVQAMRAGAHTVFDKPLRSQNLWDILRQLVTQHSSQHGIDEIRRRVLQRESTLSPDDRQTLDMIIAGKPNKVIATWLDVSVRTVESRRQSIFRHMKAETLADLVRDVVEARTAKEMTDRFA